MNFDLSKFDINDIKIIQWIVLAILLIIIVVDLFTFTGIFRNIDQAKLQRAKGAAAVSYFKDLISKKDKLTQARVISQGDVDGLLDTIQKLAKENDIAVNIGSSLETDKKDGGKNFYTMKDFSMEASGSFKNMGVFLTALRRLPDAVLDIGSIQLSGDKTNASDIHAQINFVVLTTKNDEDQ